MTASRTRMKRQKGIAIMLTGVLLVLIIPVVGLAIDASVLYAMKARLSASADAAAIAAARSLSVGLTMAEQEESARERAEDFFAANFPENSWSTKAHSVSVDVAETAYRTRTVLVTAQLTAPQYFMRMLGYESTTVKAVGKASRRDVNLVIVLDRSYSMRDDVAPGNPCSTMKSAAANFVNMFAEGRDRLALITYGSSWFLGMAPTMNFKTASPSLASRIGTISCDGNTSTAMAMWQAYQQLDVIDEPGTLNLMVVFTDGWPNGITGDLVVKRKTDTRYGYGADGYSSTTSTYSMLPSTCTDAEGDKYDRNAGSSSATYSAPGWNPNWTPANRTGVIAQWSSPTASKGDTAGPMKLYATSISSSSEVEIDAKAGCRFDANLKYLRRDIAYIPDTDIYGNSTSGYKTVSTFSSGDYAGKKRIDSPSAITYASMNLTDNTAARIRSDDALKPVIYAIGLGDVEHELLRRISNDPTSPIYDSTRPAGLYVYAPTPTELNYAFTRIASEILRIAQ